MSKDFEVVKVTSKGQMTLPVHVRKSLGIREGDHLAVYVDGEDVVLRKFSPFKKATRRDAIFNLIGAGQGPADLAEEHDKYLVEAGEKETNGRETGE